jgi:hypothetical protein
LGGRNIFSMAKNGSNIFAGTNGGVYLSTNEGLNWIHTALKDCSVQALVASGNNLFAGTHDSGVYYSSNNGNNWVHTSLSYYNIISLAINGSNIYAGVTDITLLPMGVFKSSDFGLNWSQTSLNDKVIYTFSFLGDTILAGTFSNGILYSTNNGNNWHQFSFASYPVISLSSYGNRIFAGTNMNGVFRSTNHGINWAQTSLNNQLINTLSINGNNIIAGTYFSGIYLSTNNGNNWTLRNEGFNQVPDINSFCFSDNYLFIGTNFNVWKRPLNEIIGVKVLSSNVPVYYSLNQNYPNPFNPTTNIRYQIKSSNFVSLKIYDIVGKEVAILVSEKQNPGVYEIDWNASEYSSGVYFYRLEAGDYSQTKKMILLK